jgi:hypothetical protein
MESPRIFATIMFVHTDNDSGVDKQDLLYDPAVSLKAYADFFLEQTKIKRGVQRAKLFSLELSEHNEHGDYLLDENNQIKRRLIDLSESKLSQRNA